MLTRRVSLFLVLAIGALARVSFAGEPSPSIVEVIYSDDYSISGTDALRKLGVSVQLYNLDEKKRLMETMTVQLQDAANSISANWSKEEQEGFAKKILEQRFQKIGHDELASQFQNAFAATMIGLQYDIKRYPAVIFDRGQSVVYGVTDLRRALELYRQWKTTGR